MRKILILLFSIPIFAVLFGMFICFAAGSLAKNMHAGVEAHFKSLEKKTISTLGKAEFALHRL